MNAIANISGAITDVGIDIPKNITPQQHHSLGVGLVQMKERVDRGYQWAMGDWYNTIPHGDKQAEVESLGLSYSTLKKWGIVAAFYRLDTRVSNLGFTHHRILADDARLTKSQAMTLLKQAEANEWSTRDLERERDKLLGVYEEPVQVDSGDAIQTFVSESLPNIPDRYKKQVERTVKSAAVKLAQDFDSEVQKQVSKRVKDQRKQLEAEKAKAEAEFQRNIKLQAGIKAFMTKDEFILIRNCLHPDKNPHPKAAKAFDIFNRLAVLKEWKA